jgi:hypothetical protein
MRIVAATATATSGSQGMSHVGRPRCSCCRAMRACCSQECVCQGTRRFIQSATRLATIAATCVIVIVSTTNTTTTTTTTCTTNACLQFLNPDVWATTPSKHADIASAVAGAAAVAFTHPLVDLCSITVASQTSPLAASFNWWRGSTARYKHAHAVAV